ncbi:hypothetical protein RND81_06G214500 [Saponaria officinalis]|uniref:Peptidase A1 domain-containing protein n=1 Tax=Saponaria officinalis TaxID=3572 RepID=A0AAW1KCY7_SAPOF
MPQQELCVRAETMVLLKVGVGTFQSPIPYKTYFFHVDTASEQIWLQCEDCVIPPNQCFGNPPNIFPNSKSTTYHQIPCGTHELCYFVNCKDRVCPYECTNGFCSYHAEYSDNSKIKGYLAFEIFTFGTNPRQNDINQEDVFNVVLGCNFFYEGISIRTNEIGILDLGWGPRSFIDQIKTQIGDYFSYCFPSYDETLLGAQGYLNLGLDDKFDRKDYGATTLREYHGENPYYLDLLGISVAGSRLPIDPSVFVNKGKKGGTIIDSGSSTSYLIIEAYQELKKAIMSYFETQKDYYRVNPGPREFTFDLCYKSNGHTLIDEFPNVALLFDGAELLLKPEHVYILIEDCENNRKMNEEEADHTHPRCWAEHPNC